MDAALVRQPSRFAVWRSMESRIDVVASYTALAFATLAVVVYLLV